MKKIKLKHIFSALVIIPCLLLGGCKCEGDNKEKTQEELLVEYERVHTNSLTRSQWSLYVFYGLGDVVKATKDYGYNDVYVDIVTDSDNIKIAYDYSQGKKYSIYNGEKSVENIGTNVPSIFSAVSNEACITHIPDFETTDGLRSNILSCFSSRGGKNVNIDYEFKELDDGSVLVEVDYNYKTADDYKEEGTIMIETGEYYITKLTMTATLNKDNNVEYEYETTVNYTYNIYDDTLYINTNNFE